MICVCPIARLPVLLVELSTAARGKYEILSNGMPKSHAGSEGDTEAAKAAALNNVGDSMRALSKRGESSQLNVRLINGETKREIDLLVNMSSDITVCSGVYKHDWAGKANVRKWKTDTVEKINDGALQVLCYMWNTETDKGGYKFTLDSLKETSTEQLHEANDKNCHICLKLCVAEVAAADSDGEQSVISF